MTISSRRCFRGEAPARSHVLSSQRPPAVSDELGNVVKPKSPNPDARQPMRAELCVSDRITNIPMPQEILDQPRVQPLICQHVSGAVPEHVGMDVKSNAGRFCCSTDDPRHHVGADRPMTSTGVPSTTCPSFRRRPRPHPDQVPAMPTRSEWPSRTTTSCIDERRQARPLSCDRAFRPPDNQFRRRGLLSGRSGGRSTSR